MKKKNQSANGRYISVEKLQKALSNIEINEKKNDLFCSLKKIHTPAPSQDVPIYSL